MLLVLEKSGAFIAQMVSMSFKASCLKYIHTCQKTLSAMKSDRHSAVGFYLFIALQSFQINLMAGDKWTEFSYRSLRRVGGVQIQYILVRHIRVLFMFSQFLTYSGLDSNCYLIPQDPFFILHIIFEGLKLPGRNDRDFSSLVFWKTIFVSIFLPMFSVHCVPFIPSFARNTSCSCWNRG